MQLALSLLASSFIHFSKFLLYLSVSLYCPGHDDLLLLLSAADQLLEDLLVMPPTSTKGDSPSRSIKAFSTLSP